MYALIKLFNFKACNYDELYKKIGEYQWNEWIKPADTIMIRSRINSPYFDNPQFATLKIKDGIVDQIRKSVGQRPNIDKQHPKFSIFIFIKKDKVNVLLNSSGVPLSRRGYREKIHKASLNEALAAGIILFSGWKPNQPLYDPMCGSGTLPIEAAMIGRNIPAGYYRNNFAFQNWENFESRLWNSIRVDVKNNINNQKLQIIGYDNIAANVDLARKNSKAILMHHFIKFKTRDFSEFAIDNPGAVIIINPPYGVRLESDKELEILYKLIGDVLKRKCQDSDAFIFTGNIQLAKLIGLKSKQKIHLKNGKIDCRLIHFPIQAGKYVD